MYGTQRPPIVASAAVRGKREKIERLIGIGRALRDPRFEQFNFLVGNRLLGRHLFIEDLVEQKNMLEAEVATLRAPERLELVAREKLGMRLPRGDEIVFVK